MSLMSGWGPEDRKTRPAGRGRFSWRWLLLGYVALALIGLFSGEAGHNSPLAILLGLLILFGLALLALPPDLRRRLFPVLGRFPTLVRTVVPTGGPRRRPAPAAAVAVDPLVMVRRRSLAAGGGVYLGVGKDRSARHGRAERAVMLLGPPRAGKTSAVIVPALLAHSGPAVSTSTKNDVATATVGVRAGAGTAWVFDPTGQAAAAVPGTVELRWSPVSSAASWDGALLMARAMTVRTAAGATDRSHWASRAQALLAPLLHAAAVHGRDMGVVVDWVSSHELDGAGVLLEDDRCAKAAFSSLLGIFNTEERERSSIFSATADALEAYSSESALNAAAEPNFDADRFVSSAETIYIHAPAEAQAAAAPIVCGLLSEIRRATYKAHAAGQLASGRVLFALDEAANVAPLEELPQIASEGGGQGLILLAAFQDLSQARHRWGAQADGFLTLFGDKLILPGIADTRTLDAVSQLLGEYDREMISYTRPKQNFMEALMGDVSKAPKPTETRSIQRTRVLSVGEVANIPAGCGLLLRGTEWELITLTPAHTSEPWRTLSTRRA